MNSGAQPLEHDSHFIHKWHLRNTEGKEVAVVQTPTYTGDLWIRVVEQNLLCKSGEKDVKQGSDSAGSWIPSNIYRPIVCPLILGLNEPLQEYSLRDFL